MAVNRFEQPAQFKFVDTYVPVPFEEIGKVLQSRQAKLDQGLAALDAAVMSAEQLEAIPNSIDYKYISEVKSKFNDLSMKYLDKDLSDPEIYRELNRNIRNSFDTDRIKKIRDSHLGYQNYMQQLAKNEASGRGTPKELMYDFTNYDSTSEKGVFNQLPQASLDIQGAMTEFFNQLDDSYMGTQDIDGTGMSGIMHGVTLDRAQKHAADKYQYFLNSPAGQQLVALFKARGDSRTGEQIVLEELLKEAPEHVKSRMTSTFQKQGGNGYGATGGMKFPWDSVGVKPKEGDLLGIGDIPDWAFTEKGEIDPSAVPVDIASGWGLWGMNTSKNKEEKSVINMATYTNKIKAIKERFPQFKGLSDKKAYESYMDISSQANSYSGKYQTVPPEFGRMLGQFYSDRFDDKLIEVVDSKGNVIGPSAADESGRKGVWHDIGVNPIDIKRALSGEKIDNLHVGVKGIDVGTSNLPGALMIEVTKGKKDPITVYLQTTPEMQAAYEPIKILRENVMNMDETPIMLESNSTTGEVLSGRVVINIINDEGRYLYRPKIELSKSVFNANTNSFQPIPNSISYHDLDDVSDYITNALFSSPEWGINTTAFKLDDYSIK